MKVLIGCEFSGIVREAFSNLGHKATSCDFIPSEIPGDHYQGNILDIIDDGYDLAILHPPCTYIANSGVQWLYKKEGRWKDMEKASLFFKELLRCNIPKLVIENPIPHKYALEIIGRKYDQLIQPWMFGHTECKATCLWLKNLPPLKPSQIVKEEMLKLPKSKSQRIFHLPPGPERKKDRSRTFQGIADALAAQYGGTV